MKHSKAIRAWILYDLAITPFATIILVTIMPIFFKQLAGSDLSDTEKFAYLDYTHAVSLFFVFLLSPMLGAIADVVNCKKKFLKVFSYIGILSTFFMWTINEGDWILALILVIIGNIAYSCTNIFYDAFLNDICPPKDRDKVSILGYAWGYPGGGILLALNLANILYFYQYFNISPFTATKIALVSVGVWWWIFSIPFFRNIHEKRDDSTKQNSLKLAPYGWRQVIQTVYKIKKYPQMFRFLIAYWFYSDGISTLTLTAASYAVNVLHIPDKHTIFALLIIQFTSLPFTLLFGKLAAKKSSKTGLLISLYLYLFIITLGFFMQTTIHFYILALLISLVFGGSQAISRSIFSRMIPEQQSTEFFSLFGLSGKFAAVIGPALIGIIAQITGSARYGIGVLAILFIIGILLVSQLDEQKARKEAGY